MAWRLAALALLLAPRWGEALRGAYQRVLSGPEAEAAISTAELETKPSKRVTCSEEEGAMRQKVQDFRKEYGPRFREAFADVDGPAFLTVSGGAPKASGSYVKYLANSLLHIQQIGITEGRSFIAVNIALDESVLEACQVLRTNLKLLKVVCLNVTGFISVAREVPTDLMTFWWSKPPMFQLAVESAKHPVLMMDLDIVIYQDLLGYVKSMFANHKDYILAISQDGLNPFQLNTGMVYASRARSLPFLQLWVNENNCYFGKEFGDQSALNSIYKRNLTQIGKASYDVFIVNIGIIGQICKQGSYGSHYNCLDKGAPGGLQRLLEKDGYWADVRDVLTNHSQA